MEIRNRFAHHVLGLVAFVMVGCQSSQSLPVGIAASSGAVSVRPVSTFSIVARDKKTGQLGVAVQSHWFSVGSVVPWARSGVGVVATQSLVDVRYGPMGLALMGGGRNAGEALKALTASDEARDVRQVAMIDVHGGVAVHTGGRCIAVAGDATGTAPDGSVYSAQANMMAHPGVPEAMARAFEGAQGDLADRLMAALHAAQGAGGDIRGRQSAAILVVRGESTGQEWRDRIVDLRVEDNPRPLVELDRLLTLNRAYEHMNAGDGAIEHGDSDAALREYAAAMDLAPGNAEMVFWTAVSLVNAGRVDEAMPYFAKAFADGADWRQLLRRLPASGLFPDDEALIERITGLDADPG